MGRTTLAWVRAHGGDVGNEIEDYRAGTGCGSQEKLWDRETHPLVQNDLESGEQVSQHGWNAAAGQRATEFYWAWMQERGTG